MRTCLTIAALGLLVTAATGQVTIRGTIWTGPNGADVDSVTFWNGLQQTVFDGLTWGGEPDIEDSTDFTPVPNWPDRITVSGLIGGDRYSFMIVVPLEDSWYDWRGAPPEEPRVKFRMPDGIAEPGRLDLSRMQFDVSPSVLDDRVSVRAQVDAPTPMTVEVFDVLGNRVRTLVRDELRSTLTVSWHGEADGGELLPDGLYFCRLAAGGRTGVRKVLVSH